MGLMSELPSRQSAVILDEIGTITQDILLLGIHIAAQTEAFEAVKVATQKELEKSLHMDDSDDSVSAVTSIVAFLIDHLPKVAEAYTAKTSNAR